jgi:hypothetical protein
MNSGVSRIGGLADLGPPGKAWRWAKVKAQCCVRGRRRLFALPEHPQATHRGLDKMLQTAFEFASAI